MADAMTCPLADPVVYDPRMPQRTALQVIAGAPSTRARGHAEALVDVPAEDLPALEEPPTRRQRMRFRGYRDKRHLVCALDTLPPPEVGVEQGGVA